MSQYTRGSIASSLSYQYISVVIYIVFGAIFYIIMAKFLPTYDVGIISLLMAVSTIFATVFSFGTFNSSQHFISYNLGVGDDIEIYSLVKRLLSLSSVLSLGAIVFTFAISGPVATLFFHSSSYGKLIDSVSVYIASLILFNDLHGTALGLQLFRTDARIYLSSASISYVVGIIFYLIFHSIMFLFFGITAAYALGIVLYILALFSGSKLPREGGGKMNFSVIFSYSWPLILANLIGSGAIYIDRFVVAYFLNLSNLGIYSFVLLIYSSITFLSAPIANLLLPKFSEFFSLKDKDKLVRGVALSSNILLLLYSPIALGIASISPIVLSLLAKQEYATGYVALSILMGTSTIFILGGVFSSLISAVRKTRVYILSTVSTLLSNILLSVLLIPSFGMTGAAIANSSVPVISFGILYYFSVVKGIGTFDWITPIKLLSSSLLMFVLVSTERIMLGDRLVMLPFYIITGTVFYLVALNLMRSLRRVNKEEFLFYLPEKFRLKKIVAALLMRSF